MRSLFHYFSCRESSTWPAGGRVQLGDRYSSWGMATAAERQIQQLGNGYSNWGMDTAIERQIQQLGDGYSS